MIVATAWLWRLMQTWMNACAIPFWAFSCHKLATATVDWFCRKSVLAMAFLRAACSPFMKSTCQRDTMWWVTRKGTASSHSLNNYQEVGPSFKGGPTSLLKLTCATWAPWPASIFPFLRPTYVCHTPYTIWALKIVKEGLIQIRAWRLFWAYEKPRSKWFTPRLGRG